MSSDSDANSPALACRACGEVHPDAHLVRLPDGRQVGSYSETHRRYHEAVWAMRRYRSNGTRRAYLERVAAKRGAEAMQALRTEMLTLWERRRK